MPAHHVPPIPLSRPAPSPSPLPRPQRADKEDLWPLGRRLNRAAASAWTDVSSVIAAAAPAAVPARLDLRPAAARLVPLSARRHFGRAPRPSTCLRAAAAAAAAAVGFQCGNQAAVHLAGARPVVEDEGGDGALKVACGGVG